MCRTIILIHGCGSKPPKVPFQQLWFNALEHGVKRDFPERADAFRRIRKVLVYYGDLANAVYNGYDDNDIPRREQTLADLRRLRRDEFTRAVYERLPANSGRREFLADRLSGFLAGTRLGPAIVGRFAPELLLYWERDSNYADEVIYRTTNALRQAMARGDRIAVVSHSLGSVIAYDALWELSHRREHALFARFKVDVWLTLGSPLANGLVRRRLRGGRLRDNDRHVTNVVKWVNVAADDDFVAHDKTLVDDFDLSDMPPLIRDERVFNVALENGRSNPHSDLGYLVHPVVANALVSWLSDVGPNSM